LPLPVRLLAGQATFLSFGFALQRLIVLALERDGFWFVEARSAAVGAECWFRSWLGVVEKGLAIGMRCCGWVWQGLFIRVGVVVAIVLILILVRMMRFQSCRCWGGKLFTLFRDVATTFELGVVLFDEGTFD